MGLGNFIPMSNLNICPPIKTQFRSFEYHGPKTEDGLNLPPPSSNIGKKRVYHERSDSSFTVEQANPCQMRHREQRHKKVVADNHLQDETDKLRSSTSSADLIKVKCEDNEPHHKRKSKTAYKHKKSSFLVKQSKFQFNASPMKTIKVKPGTVDMGLPKSTSSGVSAQNIQNQSASHGNSLALTKECIYCIAKKICL